MELNRDQHNELMFKLWLSALQKDNKLAFCIIGTDLKGKVFAVHGIPQGNKEHIVFILREAADALERGKNVIIT